ncbi:MAG: MarR family winged helix-turn-helix transcriptional regulator [Coriobacteriales bacterium]
MGKLITNTNCHCLKMRRSAENVIRFYDRKLSPSGVTVRQYSLLHQVGLHPGCSVSELAELAELERSTLARSLKSLFSSGYLEDKRKPGTRDKRLYLTESGKRTCSKAGKLWEEAQHEYEEAIGAETVKALENALLKLQSL